MRCTSVARWVVGLLLALWVSPVMAQTGDGALRGYVKDESGAVLPGVTVTATSSELLAPISNVTDTTGLYRLNNLPPGTYVLTAELTGFNIHRREGILVRAGATFSVDMQMALGNLQETITVSGESPMIETAKATTSITLDRDLIRAAPISSRRVFSDALDLAPGVSSRNVDDGVGRRSYYFKGAVIFSHVFTLEGAPAGSFLDSSAHSIGFGGDTVQDSELKLAGVDPASPTGTGVVMNIIAPRGGNQFRGSFIYDYQNIDWNSDNTKSGSAPGGLPTAQSVNQFDVSLGGPIMKDKVWFFATFRRADLTNGISRSEFNAENVIANDPSFESFDNYLKSNQPFFKVTAQINPKHEVTGFYQNDRSRYTSNRELDNKRFQYNSTGGSLYHGRINSVWSNQLTTAFAFNYNDKRGNDESTYNDLTVTGPQRNIHQSAFAQAGTQVGTGVLAQLDNPESLAFSDSTMTVIRGDLTYYKTGWGGGHEFRAGMWWAPNLVRETTTAYVNEGLYLQEDRYVNGVDPSAGYFPFHLRYRLPATAQGINEHDSVMAFYAQDAWSPNPRLTINGGLRIDINRRKDELLDFYRMKDTAVQPRVGASFLLTEDARNVIRASYGKLYEQVNGRDYIVQFNTTGAIEETNVYIAPDGTRSSVITPPTRSVDPSLLFDKDLHQPFIHEYSVGYNRQLKGLMSVGVAWTHRRFHDNFGEVDINGIYPDQPFQPFVGFGLVDPNQGIINKQVNNTWTQVIVDALGGDVRQEHVEQFPGAGQLHAAMAAPERHVESDRPGPLRAAGRVRQQPRPVAAAVRQRRRQHAERRRP